MSSTKELKPITKKIIWLFAIGQLGWSLMSAILTNFIESFYQPDDVSVKEGMIYFIPQGRVILGVFTIIGGIYAIGRVFDAVTDPWIGNLSDRSKNPKGRRIPFMKRAAIPLALITIMVYICPTAGNPVASKLGTNGIINGIWVLVMMLLFYLFMTIYCTPYNALIAELSRDEKTLADISTAISFTFILGSALGYVAPTIWSAITPAVGSRVWAMRIVFIVLALIAMVCCLVPALTIKETEYVDVKPTEGNAFSSLAKCFSNKNFRIFVASDICYWVGITMFQTGLLHYVTVLMKLPEAYSTILYIAMTLLSVICYVPVNKLMGHFEKKKLVFFAFLGMCLVFLITGLSGMFGLPGIVSGILVVVCAAFPMAILGIIPQTIVADIAKSDAITTGENHDGMFFAARTFSMKLGQSLSILLFTSLGTISVATGLGYRIAAFAAVAFCLAGAVILHFYNEKKVQGILKGANY
ncbi:MAG: MFS transporter [Lachnospiraceae bacterium]|uniref:MFS transporter n=1 Tax=Candidatus Weimeria bifida TaxID=2599074 RepID=A0A6N7J0N9_9FIRM|nr:MFS transporter [Candidatus Weimeria bifida]RRF97088.1 MAG: MFS transporter [Lachnospiraceae bacterium]